MTIGCASGVGSRWDSFEEALPISPSVHGTVWLHQGNRYNHPRHRHNALELNLVVRGRGHYEVGGRCHALSPGTALLITPKEDHHLEERSPDFEMWILAVESPLVDRACDGPHGSVVLGQARNGDRMRILPVDDMHWLERETRRIFGACSGELQRAGLAYVVAGVVDAFARMVPANDGAVLSPSVRRCLALLEESPAFSREELAERIGVAPDTLGEAFRRELAVGLVPYRNRLRVRRFLELAASGRLTLLQACLDAGFGSYAQFHRVFVAETGRTPREFLAERHRALAFMAH